VNGRGRTKTVSELRGPLEHVRKVARITRIFWHIS
jgi:hypothetical protein